MSQIEINDRRIGERRVDGSTFVNRRVATADRRVTPATVPTDVPPVIIDVPLDTPVELHNEIDLPAPEVVPIA